MIRDDLRDEPTYRKYEAISATDLKNLSTSYGHFLHQKENPDDYAPTISLRYGTICHARILEPERFAEEFVVPPEINKRTKAGKDEWAKWEDENKDKFAITQEELDKVDTMFEHCFKNPKAKDLLTGGEAETPISWDEVVDGMKMHFKARADYLKSYGDTLLIVDLKTVQDAGEEAFQRSLIKWKWGLQAAHYTSGFQATFPDKDVHFVFVALEKNPPYGCAIYSVSNEVLEFGEHLRTIGCRNLMMGEEYAERGEAILPYPSDIIQIDLPRWVGNKHIYNTHRRKYASQN